MHLTATLLSNERDRTIKASFFFDPEKCPKPLGVGDKVRLIGARLQMWRGYLQLSGRNIEFGQSLMSMSLVDAIAAWSSVTPAGAERHFPKLSITVIVKMWGNAKTTKGKQTSAELATS
jgi:hypothetical protein